jgi:tetratricopeptide (TPR) repeat protein
MRTLALLALLLCATPAIADEASTYYHQAMAYKKSGKIEDAIKALKQAIGAREDYAAAHFSIGILYRQRKDNEKAIRHLERATQIDGKNSQAYYSLGLAYHQAGRADDSEKALRTAAKLAPKDDQVQSALGTMLIRKDAKQAIPFLLAAVNAKPADAGYNHSLGLAYRKANDNKKAEQYLVKSASLKEDATTSFDLGVLYRRMDKKAKAIQHYEDAIRLDPKLAAAYWDVAHLYTQEKREDDAIGAYEKYLELTRGKSKDAEIAKKRIKELKGVKKSKK